MPFPVHLLWQVHKKYGISPQIVYDLRRKGHALSLRMIRYVPKENDNLLYST